MKLIISCALTLATFAAFNIPALKKRKGITLLLYALGMILFFGVYNIRTLDRNITFYHPTNQSMYQPEYLEEGEYPDAFLDEFFRGKTVYVADDAYEVSDDVDLDIDSLDKFDDEGNYFLYRYYHSVNMWNYLDFNGAEVIKDRALNSVRISEEQKVLFDDLGYANDMMRYTFPLTRYNGEWGNGFYYYWFYNAFISESHVYICTEDIDDGSGLVVLCQHERRHDTDSYYIASRSFIEGVIAR
ncbi:MAG: hypothetical protein K6G58_11105 [Lachnospiraceae bacterium]|nr:hypothetical protein [Lachnospiraceae bacterium]